MKKLLALLIALAMLWAVVPSLAEDGASEEPVSVTIFHTNDTHGRYDSAEGMGFAMMASFVNAERANGANVLVLDAGDTLHGTVFANIGEGENIVEVMNSIGYSAMTPGNHDFNYGYDRLKELEETMDFPLLNANILLEDGSHAFTPYTILEIAARKSPSWARPTPPFSPASIRIISRAWCSRASNRWPKPCRPYATRRTP